MLLKITVQTLFGRLNRDFSICSDLRLLKNLRFL